MLLPPLRSHALVVNRPVQLAECLREAVCCVLGAADSGSCHALELLREFVETIAEGSEIVADRLLARTRLPVWSLPLPHAVLRIASAQRWNLRVPWSRRFVYGWWRLARSEVRPQTFVDYGKQLVNPLSGRADFPEM
jgi:hypothetical protein